MSKDKERIKKPRGVFGIIAGGAVVFGALSYLISLPVQRLPLSGGDFFGRFFFATIFFLGGLMLAKSLWIMSLARKLKKLERLFDGSRRIPLDTATAYMQCSLSRLVQDARTLQARRYAPGLYADLLRRDLVFLNPGEAVDAPSASRDVSPLRERYKKSSLPLYLVGVVWIAYALYLPLYRTVDFVLVIILSAIVFFVSSWHCRERVLIFEQEPEAPQPAPSTGDQPLDDTLGAMQKHIEELRRLDASISGKLDAPVADILRTTEQIVDYLKKNPSGAGQMRQFFNYTLPTTISLLQNYDELSGQRIQGDNIARALEKIEGMIDTVVAAFHRQLDSLYRDKTLDIEVELEVMRDMLSSS